MKRGCIFGRAHVHKRRTSQRIRAQHGARYQRDLNLPLHIWVSGGWKEETSESHSCANIKMKPLRDQQKSELTAGYFTYKSNSSLSAHEVTIPFQPQPASTCAGLHSTESLPQSPA